MATRSPGVSCCLVCAEPAFASIDNKLLTSTQCGHRICRRCLQSKQKRVPQQASAADSRATRPGAAFATGTLVECPLCGTVAAGNQWEDREADESLYEQEKAVRQRVFNIYNSTRVNFDTTPAYNSYLEKREETIFELVFGVDDARRRQLQEELHSYETENQKQIVESRQKLAGQRLQEIKDIVEKEGTFYELVQQAVGPGLRYGAKSFAALIHPLQRAHPDLFPTNDNTSAVTPTSEVSATSAILGTGSQPKPLQSGLDYNKMARRSAADRGALLRACGLSKERIGRRISQELWGGLEIAAKRRSKQLG